MLDELKTGYQTILEWFTEEERAKRYINKSSKIKAFRNSVKYSANLIF